MMTRETLYDAITEVKDELIIEARETKPAKSRVRWLKFGSIAAAAALVVGLGAGVFSGKIPLLPIGGKDGGGGHNEGSTFMSYAGPVFPLTTVEGGEGLTAEREITYDFQGWMAGDPDHPYYGLPVTDSYTLTNPTGEDRDVTLLYPFVGGFYMREGYDRYPVLTVDGEEVDAGLLTGKYSHLNVGRSGGLPSMNNPESWTEYRTLLSDGRYQASALEDWPDLSDIPATVYEITNPWVAEDAEAEHPNIHAAFSFDSRKTRILSYNFNGGSFDPENGTRRNSFDVPQPPAAGSSVDPDFYEKERAERHYIITIGEPVDSFQTLGVSDGNPASTNYLEWGVEIGADVRQYETDLDSALRTVFDIHYADYSTIAGADMLFGAMKDALLDTGILLDDPGERYDLAFLEDLDFPVFNRVFYLKAQVTIPAGESVAVEASYLKEGSYDFACTGSENKSVYGYDLVTKLGANLDFTAQTAKTVNTEGVEIVRQNFGFDWENGVDTVTLDQNEEHYYLEVRKATKK